MYIAVDDLKTPDEHNNFISAKVRFEFITDDDNVSESVAVWIKLPSTDAALSVIRKNAITDAKRLLIAVLNQIESKEMPKE